MASNDMHATAFTIACIILAAATTSALGQAPAEPAPVDDNAALHYYQALLLMDLDDEERALLRDWTRTPLNDAVDSLLFVEGESVQALRRGAQIQRCDWGLRGERYGLELVLPHVGPARELVALAGLRARVRLKGGETMAAVDDLFAAVVFCRHLAQQGGLVCYLRGAKLESDVLELIIKQVEPLPAANRLALLERWRALPPARPLPTVVEDEGRTVASWLRRLVREDRVQQMYEFLELMRADGIVRAAAGNDKAKLRQMIGAMEADYLQIADLMRLPPEEFDEMYDAWQTDFRRSAGPLSRVLVPEFKPAYGPSREYAAKREKVEAALR